MNKFARSITEWTNVCDKRESRLISHILYTSEYQSILQCGKHGQAVQIGTVSRIGLCRWSWGLEIYFRWNIVYFRKPYVRSNWLDVQETNFIFARRLLNLPGCSRHRHWTVEPVRCGTRRWAHWTNALFTTVHSGARRTSELETNLSLPGGQFVTSSVLFHTHKYGETRMRTKFRFVSKMEGNSVATQETSESGFSLQDKESKSLLKSDLRSGITNFKQSLIKEVSRIWQELLIYSEWKLIILQQGVIKKNNQNKIGKSVMSKNWREFKNCKAMNIREKD